MTTASLQPDLLHAALSRTCEEFVDHASRKASRIASRHPAQNPAPPALRRDDASLLYRSIYRAPTADLLAMLPTLAGTQRDDTATKFLLRRHDDLETESVILPQRGRADRIRHALCVSSQVGCAMGCEFCETAQMGFIANLSVAEIVAQWMHARWTFGTSIDNIVFMGMGEPMDNLDTVLQAVRVLTDRNGPAVAASRITISTVGRPDGIDALNDFCADAGYRRLKLAVSINAPNDEIRRTIMPIARAAPLDQLLAAMKRWTNTARRRVLAEYVIIPDVNDAPEHADELAERLAPIPSTVNVIPYNPRRNSPWPAPDSADVDRFVERLRARGQAVRRRRTLGRDLMAACGQLGNERIQRRRWMDDAPSPAALSVRGRPVSRPS
jgi:23S rRNA (adenine2503-C2)-methyltransferase